MTLHESETKLTEINNSIAELLKERENVLKEWNIAFSTENQDEITCIAEGIEKNMDVVSMSRSIREILFMQKLWKLESMREKL